MVEAPKISLKTSQWQQAIEKSGAHLEQLLQELGNPDDIKDAKQKEQQRERLRGELVKVAELTFQQTMQNVRAIFLGEGDITRLTDINRSEISSKNDQERLEMSLEEVIQAVKFSPEKAYQLIVAIVDEIKNRVSGIATAAYLVHRKPNEQTVGKFIAQFSGFISDVSFLRQLNAQLQEIDPAYEGTIYLNNSFQEMILAAGKMKQMLVDKDWAKPMLAKMTSEGL